MSRELLILRHGKSDWTAETDDFQRPLKDRGKRSAQRVATWLMKKQLVPDYIVSSPAVRAIETAHKACKAMGLRSDAVVTNQAAYLASRRNLLNVIASCPAGAQRVMLVGHNPGLEDLLQYLVNGPIPRTENDKLLTTGTLARLEMPFRWEMLPHGCANLKDLIHPATLEKKFPFPAPDGTELRDRPAYYYSQSSVIPFQKNKAGLRILLIASSKKKHLVVPKGIKDPGMSAEESASKEAWEEAGVRGHVMKTELGQYVYEKWGAECTVKVYPMRVSQVVPESQWEERHRGRKWVSPVEAQARLKQKALVPMIDELVRRYG